jgi:putative addiction module component (TIGR02574 family)
MLPQEIQKLSTSEKLQLVQDLWDDIATHPEGLSLSPEQEAELDRRLTVHENDPLAGIPWDQALQKLKSKP